MLRITFNSALPETISHLAVGTEANKLNKTISNTEQSHSYFFEVNYSSPPKVNRNTKHSRKTTAKLGALKDCHRKISISWKFRKHTSGSRIWLCMQANLWRRIISVNHYVNTVYRKKEEPKILLQESCSLWSLTASLKRLSKISVSHNINETYCISIVVYGLVDRGAGRFVLEQRLASRRCHFASASADTGAGFDQN